MKFLVIFICIFLVLNHANSSLISITTAPSGDFSSPLKIFLQSSKVSSPTTVLLTFRDVSKVIEISGQHETFTTTLDFPQPPLRNRISNGSLTILRGNICSTKFFTIKRLQEIPSAFIQLNKPVYRPGELIQFQIITINTKGRAYQANNIIVAIFDSRDVVQEVFTSLVHQQSGLIMFNHTIENDVNIGEWKISVKIDGDERTSVERRFLVKKYELPLVGVEIGEEISERDGKLGVEVVTKNAYGEVVGGGVRIFENDVNLIDFENEVDLEIFKNEENFENHKNIQNSKNNQNNDLFLKLRNNSKIQPNTLDLFENKDSTKLTVKFDQTSTNLQFENSKIVNIRRENRAKIETFYPQVFIPGKDYEIDVKVDSNSTIELWQIMENSKIEFLDQKMTVKGMAKFYVKNDGDLEKLVLEVRCDGEKLRQIVTKDGVVIDSIEVMVDKKSYKPLENIKIDLKSSSKLSKISVIFTGKSGISHSDQIDCFDEFVCNFYIPSQISMLPQSILSVYSLEKSNKILRGSTVVKFDNFPKDNFVSLEVSNLNPKPGEKINIKIDTKSDSLVTLLIYDKKLNFLFDDGKNVQNFIAESLVKQKFGFSKHQGHFDGVNLVTINDLEIWKPCNDNEMSLAGKSYKIENIEELKNEEIDNYQPFTVSSSKYAVNSSKIVENVRKNFPEVLVFKVYKKYGEISLTIPDSMTTWMINSYAVSQQFGIASVDVVELKVEKEMFVEIIYPSEPKFGEILEIEVVVFNRWSNEESLIVDVEILSTSDFELLSNLKTCEKLQVQKQKTSVLLSSPQKLQFFLKPLKKDKILLKVEAKEITGRFKDVIEKEIKIERDTIKIQDKMFSLFNFAERKYIHQDFKTEFNYALKDSVRLSVEVSGSVFPDGLKYMEHSSYHLSETGIQVISRFAKAFFIYKYLHSSKMMSSRQKQYLKEKLNLDLKVLKENYKNQDGGFMIHKDPHSISSQWLTAYIAKVLSQAMQIDAIDSDSDLINEHLYFLKSCQNNDGSFNETNSHQFPSNPDGDPKDNQFHLTAFVLHAFLLNRNFVDEDFSEVIEKCKTYISYKIPYIDTYDALFGAYVLTLNGDTETAKSIMKIMEKKSYTDGVVKFWTMRKKRKVSGSSKILIAAYAVLTYLELKDFEKAEKIIKYLLREKDEKGYFRGIFDTNVALEALTEVEKFSSDSGNLLIKIWSDKMENVTINVNSRERTKIIDLPVGLNDYTISVENQGFAMITTHYSWEVMADQNLGEYKIDAEVIEDGKIVKICGKFAGDDNVEILSMIEVEFERNYAYDPSSDPMSQNLYIQTVEMRRGGKLLQIFFDELINEKSCFNLKVMPSSDENVKYLEKKSKAKLYNSYGKDNFAVVYFSMNQQCV